MRGADSGNWARSCRFLTRSRQTRLCTSMSRRGVAAGRDPRACSGPMRGVAGPAPPGSGGLPAPTAPSHIPLATGSAHVLIACGTATDARPSGIFEGWPAGPAETLFLKQVVLGRALRSGRYGRAQRQRKADQQKGHRRAVSHGAFRACRASSQLNMLSIGSTLDASRGLTRRGFPCRSTGTTPLMHSASSARSAGPSLAPVVI